MRKFLDWLKLTLALFFGGAAMAVSFFLLFIIGYNIFLHSELGGIAFVFFLGCAFISFVATENR